MYVDFMQLPLPPSKLFLVSMSHIPPNYMLSSHFLSSVTPTPISVPHVHIGVWPFSGA